MDKKYRINIYSLVCFLFFLLGGFFYLLINKASADLELQYPTISGQTITASSKLPDVAIYLFNAGMSIGVACVFISLAIAGAMYFLSPASAELRAMAKDRVSGAISGLLILALTYLIITSINPQLKTFNPISSLPSTQITTTTTKAPGVYFYNGSGCSDNSVLPNTSNVLKFGALVDSVNIVPNTANSTYYISILYGQPNLSGKCEYINPNSGCVSVTSFASSASVHKYDFDPNGDGIYFFRKSCFNDQNYSDVASLAAHCEVSGYYKVPNSSINGIYFSKLESLSFTGVPTDEQDCTQYDKNGSCTGRTPPTLAGENISSVIINGNYLVLFMYVNKNITDVNNTVLDSCQEFPTNNDINKLGPRQIKWKQIRNFGSIIPNYVAIIPIQQ